MESPSIFELRELVEAEWMGDLSQLCLESLDLFQSSSWGRCSSLCRVLLDAIWERLNTGHWRDVAEGWRRLHSIVSLLQARLLLRGKKAVEAIKAADMGLLMGSPILDDALATLADHIHQSLPVPEQTEDPEPQIKIPRLLPSLSPKHAIPRAHLPSMETFNNQFLLPQKPLIISGLLSDWPASSKWNVDYLRRHCGHRHVPVEIGSRYNEEGWGQQIMTFNDFCRRFMTSDSETGYLAQHELFTQIPSLANDWTIPDYCHLCDDDSGAAVNAWFGPAGTVSPLHQDPRNNILTQVFGSKYVRLYDLSDTAAIYPNTDGILTNTSQVDVEKIDAERFPLILRVPYWEAVLEKGDALFIPRQWWHYLRSLEPSFSVSFWFGPSV